MAKKKGERQYSLVEKEACAKHFGVSLAAVNKWISEKKWDITDYQSVERHRDETYNRDPDTEELKKEKLKQEVRYKKSQADKMDLQLRHTKGELIEVELIEVLLGNIGINIKTHLEGYAGTLPPKLEGKTPKAMTKIISDASESLLNSLANMQKEVLDDK